MDGSVSFFSYAIVSVAMVNIVGGGLFGLIIGFVGPYSELMRQSQNCTRLASEDACDSLGDGNCTWNGTCMFRHICDTALHDSRERCEEDGDCVYWVAGQRCLNRVGLSATKHGVFAGAMVVGGLMGSSLTGRIIRAVGLRKTLLLLGVVAMVASLMVHGSRTYGNDFFLLIVGRFGYGIAGGIASVACPMYCKKPVVLRYCPIVEVFFQVFITVGIFVAAVSGWLVDPSVTGHPSDPQHYAVRMQLYIGISSFFSVVMFLIGLSAALKSGAATDVGLLRGERTPSHDESKSWRQMKPLLFGAFILSICQQLTGINAIVNFAPSIAGNLGFSPLVGNIVIMGWNSVMVLTSIPVVGRLQLRNRYLIGILGVSFSCFLTGIPLLPGMASENTRHVTGAAGILLFTFFFEMLVGPSFYILAQELFPPSFRPKGASFTIGTEFGFNFLLNLMYPILVAVFSGGEGGDIDRGTGIMFILFGLTGLVGDYGLYKFLHPFKPSAATTTITEEMESS